MHVPTQTDQWRTSANENELHLPGYGESGEGREPDFHFHFAIQTGKNDAVLRVYLSLCVVCCVVVPGWGCGGQWELHSHFRLTCMPANRASCPRAAGAYARPAGLKQVAGSERGGHGTHR